MPFENMLLFLLFFFLKGCCMLFKISLLGVRSPCVPDLRLRALERLTPTSGAPRPHGADV